MTVRIRLAWWSPRAFPFVLAVGGLAFVTVTHEGRGSLVLLGVLLAAVGLLVNRLLAAEIVLGDRWMKVPGPHPWIQDVVPSLGLASALFPEPAHPEGRLVRLADVAGWVRKEGGVELRMKDGTIRWFTLQGLRSRDRAQVIEHLVSVLGG